MTSLICLKERRPNDRIVSGIGKWRSRSPTTALYTSSPVTAVSEPQIIIPTSPPAYVIALASAIGRYGGACPEGTKSILAHPQLHRPTIFRVVKVVRTTS